MVVSVLLAGYAFGGEWREDFDQALATAKEQNKYVLVDFSGSDWCGWCIKLDKEVFSQPAFKDYAEKNLVLALLDFPRRKEQAEALKKRNADLLEKYGVEGFPTVLVLSPDGDVVGRTGYMPGGPEAYIKHVQKFIDKHSMSAKTK